MPRRPLRRADRRVDPALVEEALRYETPTLFVARVPLEPVEIGPGELHRVVEAQHNWTIKRPKDV